MQQKLEQLHQQMREKFSPLAEDESGILWGKATLFASAMMYMEPYQVADILVSINGQTFDDQHPFSSFDETRKEPYQAQVLRANDAGSLELIDLDIPEDIHFYCATL